MLPNLEDLARAFCSSMPPFLKLAPSYVDSRATTLTDVPDDATK